jgi:hypothetical protein
MLRWIIRLVLFRFLARRFGPFALLALVLARVLPWERERREAQQLRRRSGAFSS